MIERAAEAMQEVWVDGQRHRFNSTYAGAMARAAIEAMMQPTEAMVTAGKIAAAKTGDITDVWQAMLRAALEE